MKSGLFSSSYLLTTFIIFLGVAVAFSARAASMSSIGITVAPENPAPFENTTITLNSYVSNLDSVLITWFVNDKNTLSGIGQKSFSVNAPAAGGQTIVRARIALPDGELETRIVIKPNTMTLLWQAEDSYVPPFYKGKALATADSDIKIVAIPEVKNISAKNMVYSWKRNYTNDQSASGYGKSFYTYTNDYLENADTVSVVASTVDGASSESSITVGTSTPKILFYKNNSNFGTIWEHALQSGYRIQGEEILAAIPYFISPKNIAHPDLLWRWYVNNSAINLQSFRKNYLPLKVEEGISGVSTIRLQLDSKSRIFQSASKEISVEF